MMEMFEWFTAESSLWATLAKWACVAAAAVVVAAVVWLMVAAQRADLASKGRAFSMAGAVRFVRPKSEPKPAAAVVPVAELVELDNVVPFLPRAEREALRAGVWS